MDHAKKLKFSSYVHLPSIKRMFPYKVIVCSVGKVIISEHGSYISALLWNTLGADRLIPGGGGGVMIFSK